MTDLTIERYNEPYVFSGGSYKTKPCGKSTQIISMSSGHGPLGGAGPNDHYFIPVPPKAFACYFNYCARRHEPADFTSENGAEINKVLKANGIEPLRPKVPFLERFVNLFGLTFED
jgi:hypothetical protein